MKKSFKFAGASQPTTQHEQRDSIMSEIHSSQSRSGILAATQLQTLIDLLRKSGYEMIGPSVRENTVLMDRLQQVTELPVGCHDEHDGGHYRLTRNGSGAYFEYVVGPQSVKKYLYPARQVLWRGEMADGELKIEAVDHEAPSYAFFGVRPCELHAVAIQDKVLIEGPYPDPAYKARREKCLMIAVNCTHPGGTCFCASMETGPRAQQGFDLALTEVRSDREHYFVVHAGSARGDELLAALKLPVVTEAALKTEDELLTTAAGKMGRQLDTAHIKELLQRNDEHPRWNTVAERCLNCANCTLVCPTCFCVTVEDTTDLTGKKATRTRRWDSCFTIDFSYIHGGAVRTSASARYRHWMSHKLANWHDQFGSSGCVGCGRCITWCPVGIDITEEAAAIRSATMQV